MLKFNTNYFSNNPMLLFKLILFQFFVELLDIVGLATENRTSRMLSLLLRWCCLCVVSIKAIVVAVKLKRSTHIFQLYNDSKELCQTLSQQESGFLIIWIVGSTGVLFELLIPTLLQGGVVFIEDCGPSYLISYAIVTAFHALIIAIASDKLLP
jgi:hypothetical protein